MPDLYFHPYFLPQDSAIFTANNRAFRYGDALFESMVQFNYRTPLLNDHFDRLIKGMQVLQMDCPTYLTVDFLQEKIIELSHRNECPNARIRLTIFRNDGGFYLPQTAAVACLLTVDKISNQQFELNREGLRLGCYRDIVLNYGPLSPFKTANALPYVLSAIYQKQHQLDECVLLNSQQRVADTTTANIFVQKRDLIYTPPLEDGGVNGIMKKKICKIISNLAQKSLPLRLKEQSLKIEDLLMADEIFLSNAVRGIRWVASFGERSYDCKTATLLTQQLNY